MHIIITRPIEDSLELIRNLSFKNHVVTHLPLINIKKISNKKNRKKVGCSKNAGEHD